MFRAANDPRKASHIPREASDKEREVLRQQLEHTLKAYLED